MDDSVTEDAYDERYLTNDKGSALSFTITQGEYTLASDALHDIDSRQASVTRVMAAFMMTGGREQWAAIVSLFKDTAEQADCPVENIERIHIYRDGSATAVVNAPDDTSGRIQ